MNIVSLFTETKSNSNIVHTMQLLLQNITTYIKASPY